MRKLDLAAEIAENLLNREVLKELNYGFDTEVLLEDVQSIF